MKRWVDWLLGWVDLLEAEGRQGLRAVRGLAVVLALVGACAAVAVMGAAAILGAIFMALSRVMDPAWSALITGAVALVAGGVGLWLGARTQRLDVAVAKDRLRALSDGERPSDLSGRHAIGAGRAASENRKRRGGNVWSGMVAAMVGGLVLGAVERSLAALLARQKRQRRCD